MTLCNDINIALKIEQYDQKRLALSQLKNAIENYSYRDVRVKRETYPYVIRTINANESTNAVDVLMTAFFQEKDTEIQEYLLLLVGTIILHSSTKHFDVDWDRLANMIPTVHYTVLPNLFEVFAFLGNPKYVPAIIPYIYHAHPGIQIVAFDTVEQLTSFIENASPEEREKLQKQRQEIIAHIKATTGDNFA
jgi:hypothetical protein